jgi:hypothetical protein
LEAQQVVPRFAMVKVFFVLSLMVEHEIVSAMKLSHNILISPLPHFVSTIEGNSVD